MHNFQDLISVFKECFFISHNTVLVKGEGEPIYLPQNESRNHNEIHFAHGFFASALHEISHWLIAGEQRRKLEDFGYWYEPDGRSEAQQSLFEKMEVKPQAIEWILSKACGFSFRVSCDNLNGHESDTEPFKKAVLEQVKTYLKNGLPERTEKLKSALSKFYKNEIILTADDFSLNEL